MKFIILLSLLVSSSSFAAVDVVYGSDNRIDVNDFNNPLHRNLSQSIAVMIEGSDIFSYRNGFNSLAPQSLKDKHKVCAEDKFAHQQAAASCTGFLIAPNLLVTAGHCMSGKSCSENKWVFDYKLKSGDKKNVGFIPHSSIYSCKRIVQKQYSAFSTSKDDWAIIELDRKVKDRKPLVLSNQQVRPLDSVFVIGSPMGLPLKVTSGKVRKASSNYFSTNLDTFMGNSGSPVFNSNTGEVEGVLVRGEADYDYGWLSLGCGKVNSFPENGGRGEEVTSIKLIKKALR